MKKALFIISVCIITSGFAQEIPEYYSFYFKQEAFKKLDHFTKLDKYYHGKYELKETETNGIRHAAGEHIIFDESGIYIEKNKVLHISREEVRENSQYLVRDGWLHGVVKNDSLPVTEQEDMYYFLLPTKTYLWDKKDGTNQLYAIKGRKDLILASYEDVGHYSVINIGMEKGGITLMEMTFEQDCSVMNIQKRELVEGDYPTYLLSPTVEEWSELINCFKVYDQYVALAE